MMRGMDDLAVVFFGIDTQTWVGLGIGSVVTIMVAVLIYRKQKTPRTLDYAIRSTQDLTSDASPHLRTRMEILWKGQGEDSHLGRILKEPRIVNYHIRNTGKRAIDADDFKKEIEVRAGSGSIVDVIVTEVSHEGVIELGPISSDVDDATFFIPSLMNPKDWINIQVITDGCPNAPKLTSWIREESRPMERQQSILYPPVWEVLQRSVVDRAGEFVKIALIIFGVNVVVFGLAVLIYLISRGTRP
jgi:hypothetical protein